MGYSSSSSVGTSAQTGISTYDGSSSSSAMYGTLVQASSPAEEDGLYSFLGGEAIAIGDDTLAAGSVSAAVVDEGDISTLNGSATMVAASEAEEGETAFASANTFTESAGAEFAFVYTQMQQSSYQSGTGSVATASSTTTTTAYNLHIDGSDPPSEIYTRDEPYTGPDAAPVESNGGVDLDGNVASVDFFAAAVGDDSLVSVDAFALAVEDELSIASAFVELGVD